MANLTDLLSRVRTELGDQQKNFTFTANGDGSTVDFFVNNKPVELVNLQVLVDNSPIPYPQGYLLEPEIGIITFATPPSAGKPIFIQGVTDRYFTDDQLCVFISDAITEHTYNRVDAYGSQVTLSSIPPVEEYPVAILATIEALWALATDAAFDIDISAPDGVTIPRSERFSQLSSIIQQRWEQYRMLCSQLNVGLWKIEMGTLIRVSRTTNKYVPVYVNQEVDDSSIPQRVYIQNNLTGRNPVLTRAQIYDILLTQGNDFEVEFDFPFDASLFTWAAQIRTYPNSPSIYANFKIDILSYSNTLSRVKLSLQVKDTEYLPVRGFWDLLATEVADVQKATTFIRGQVFTTQAVTDSSGALIGSW